jgi:hypothetical protein
MGQGETGPKGPKGDKGDKGDQGPQGKEASGDPQQVASILSGDGAFAARVAPLIAKDNTIGATVAEKVASEQIPRTLVTNALITSPNFANKLIDVMAIDTRFRGPQGPPGSAFDEISVRNALEPRGMWCADGQMCRIPSTSPGTYLTGDTVIQRGKNILLGGGITGTSGSFQIDNKHGISVRDDNYYDGPFIYGNSGGNLGTFAQINSTSGTLRQPTLAWDHNNIYVKGNVIQSANDFKLGYKNIERGDSGESRALVKDTGNILKINFSGDFAGGTAVDGPILNVNSGNLKIGKWTIKNVGDDLQFINKDNIGVATITNDGNIKMGTQLQMANEWTINPTGHLMEIHYGNGGIPNNTPNNNTLKLSFHKDGHINTGTASGSVNFKDGWSINPDGNLLRFSKGNNRANIDGARALGNLVGTNIQYQFKRSNNGGCLDQASHNQPCDWNNEWRRFNIQETPF